MAKARGRFARIPRWLRPARRLSTISSAHLGRSIDRNGRLQVDDVIRARHPSYDEPTARWALFRMLVGDALFRRAWPHAPLVDP